MNVSLSLMVYISSVGYLQGLILSNNALMLEFKLWFVMLSTFSTVWIIFLSVRLDELESGKKKTCEECSDAEIY